MDNILFHMYQANSLKLERAIDNVRHETRAKATALIVGGGERSKKQRQRTDGRDCRSVLVLFGLIITRLAHHEVAPDSSLTTLAYCQV